MIRHLRLVQLMPVVVLAVPLLTGCGNDEGPAPAPAPTTSATSLSESKATGGAGSAQVSPDDSKCTNLQVRECSVKLSAQGAVQNCFVGLQLCSDGVWGTCQEPDRIESQLNSQ